MLSVGYIPGHVSRTDDRALNRGDTVEELDDDSEQPVSRTVQRVSSTQPIGGAAVADETERTRMIADIMRLLGEPCLPDATRHAGLTLVGWLARRRAEEAPHGLGIEEARESERRILAARKSRT
jgi:hypothetical protein